MTDQGGELAGRHDLERDNLDSEHELERMLDVWKREVHLERELGDLADMGDLRELAGGTPRDEGKWVSLAEAADVAGVSRSSLRAWYRAGELPSRLEPGPHGLQRMVQLEAVLERARRSPQTRARRQTQEVDVAQPERPEADALVKLVETVCDQAAERERRAEERAAEAESALRAALERAAATEAEVRILREQLGRSR